MSSSEVLRKRYPPELYQQIQPQLHVLYQNSNIVQIMFGDLDLQFRSKIRDFSDAFKIIQDSEWGYNFFFNRERVELEYLSDNRLQYLKPTNIQSPCKCARTYHTHLTDRQQFHNNPSHIFGVIWTK